MTADIAAASAWARESLADGSELAMLVRDRLAEFSTALVIAPALSPSMSISIDDRGRGMHTSDVDLALRPLLESFRQAGARTLIVEDDLARCGDPRLPAKVVYAGDRVLRWCDFIPGAQDPVRLLRTGASGYPLNAIISSADAGALDLTPGRTLSYENLRRVSAAGGAVITSVYDAESYLILVTENLAVSMNLPPRTGG
ncbi:MAG TPA: hypothetical protein VMB79_05070 [Jatrophihabitans sp.]|nr:hypothetical protein [Jatrophihabitans sp.]